MVFQVQEEMMRRRRPIHVLHRLARPKPIRRRCSLDILGFIKELKLRVEAINEKCKNICNQIQVPTEVKVKKVEMGFLIGISCEKGKDVLVTVLEAFEEMGLNVLHAKVSSENHFSMDVLGQVLREHVDPLAIQEAVLKALQNKMEDGIKKNNLVNY